MTTTINISGGSFGSLSLTVNLPALTGSDKQVAWATDFRVKEVRAALDKLLERGFAADPRRDAMLASLARVVESRTTAKAWIDGRGDTMGLLRAAASEVR